MPADNMLDSRAALAAEIAESVQLALHAEPPSTTNRADYIDLMKALVGEIATLGLAKFVDAYIDALPGWQRSAGDQGDRDLRIALDLLVPAACLSMHHTIDAVPENISIG